MLSTCGVWASTQGPKAWCVAHASATPRLCSVGLGHTCCCKVPLEQELLPDILRLRCSTLQSSSLMLGLLAPHSDAFTAGLGASENISLNNRPGLRPHHAPAALGQPNSKAMPSATVLLLLLQPGRSGLFVRTGEAEKLSYCQRMVDRRVSAVLALLSPSSLGWSCDSICTRVTDSVWAPISQSIVLATAPHKQA